jgi:UDP-N-acetylmuramate dehydrogenase
MAFPDIVPDLKSKLPELRGRLMANVPLADSAWFRVGGAAQALFMPADEPDLAYFLAHLAAEVPLMFLGAASNVIIRDGGIPGVVVRLGNRFAEVKIEDGHRVRAGCGILDGRVSRAARDAGVAGLEFLSGIPGGIGGALRMNAGAYGGETKDVLIEARGVDRQGNVRTFTNADMGYSYRRSGIGDDTIFTEALFQGRPPGDPAEIEAAMTAIAEKRKASQPPNKTCGSTFKNPSGQSAWRLIDAAGCRGFRVGDAQVSEMHCNFLINLGSASASDIEILGETVRQRVKENSGVELEWEIKRVGVPK